MAKRAEDTWKLQVAHLRREAGARDMRDIIARKRRALQSIVTNLAMGGDGVRRALEIASRECDRDTQQEED